jgi:F-box and WD-40 domain protein CDC4
MSKGFGLLILSVGVDTGEGVRRVVVRKKGKGRRWKTEDEDNFIDEDDLMASMSVPIQPPALDHFVPPSLRSALGLDERPDHHYTNHDESVYEAADTASDDSWEAEADSGKRSDECCATEGWGQPNALVVSGGCDKTLRVWDVKSG